MTIRIKCLSDLHGNLPAIAPGTTDLLIIAGDICPHLHALKQAQWMDTVFRRWLNDVQAKFVVVTWGNHDKFATSPFLIPRLPWVVLNNSAIVVEGIKIWGTPWTLPFGNWSFMAEEHELAKMLARMPDDTSIVVSHGPPYGIHDFTRDGKNAGSYALLERIKQVRPQLVVCGHIHEARGYTETDFGIIANCSLVDAFNQPQHGPMDLEMNVSGSDDDV